MGSVPELVMLTPAFTVSENVWLAVFDAESVTVMLKEFGPTAVGLPFSSPAELRLRPAGNADPLVTVHVYPVPVPPDALNETE